MPKQDNLHKRKMELNKGYENGDEGTSTEDPNSINTVQDNTSHEVPINIDQFLESVNDFGIAQKIIISILCLMYVPCSYQFFIMVFIGNEPAWSCSPLGNQTVLCDGNRTYTVEDSLHSTRCKLPRNEWTFTKNSSYSIVTEWDLVCEKEYLLYLTTTAMFVGMGFGSIIFGWTSDRYGRKKTLFLCFTGLILTSFARSFVNEYWLFITTRLISGLFQAGLNIQLIVMCTELVRPKHHSKVMAYLCISFSVGCIMLGVQAWLIPNRQNLEIATSIPYIIGIIAYGFVPESMRWLRIKGKIEKAEDGLRKIALRNRKIPNASLSHVPDKTVTKTSYKDLFKTRSMTISILVQGFLFFGTTLTYYGITMASDRISGHLYRDYILILLTEIPAYITMPLLTNRYGRKTTIISCVTFGGLSCIVIALIPVNEDAVNNWLRVSVAMFGRALMTLAYGANYLWASELNPTVIRSQAMSFVSACTYTGGGVAPWISQGLTKIHQALPFYILGGISIVSGLLSCFLRETLNEDTKETIEDFETNT